MNSLNNIQRNPNNIIGILIVGFTMIAAIVILTIAGGSWFRIDQGERGVILRNGGFLRVAEPGLGFKWPLVDSVTEISVRDHTLRIEGMEAYSFDQQPAHLRVSVIYRVTPELVEEMYSEYGSLKAMEDRVLDPKIKALVKIVFGGYNAATAIQKRGALASEIEASITKSFAGFPVRLVGMQIEDIAFSDVYVKSIEQRMLAQVQIETTRQQKETATINAEILVVKATADADAKRQQFTAEADGIMLRGEAEAKAILAKAKALAANTNLVDLNAVDKWNGVLPSTMLPGSALPFLSVK